MMVWHFFVILGVKLLSSGRAAILGFTMPVRAVLSGLLFFRERVTPMAWLGVACALAGALSTVLFKPRPNATRYS